MEFSASAAKPQSRKLPPFSSRLALKLHHGLQHEGSQWWAVLMHTVIPAVWRLWQKDLKVKADVSNRTFQARQMSLNEKKKTEK